MAGKKISLTRAKELVKNHKDSPVNKDKLMHSLMFDASLIKELIEQPGCVSVRLFKAKTKVSASSLDATIVLVGVDINGNNITSTKSDAGLIDAVMLDEGQTCPPECGSDDQGSNI